MKEQMLLMSLRLKTLILAREMWFICDQNKQINKERLKKEEKTSTHLFSLFANFQCYVYKTKHFVCSLGTV